MHGGSGRELGMERPNACFRYTFNFQLWEKVPGAPIIRYSDSSDLDIRTGAMVVGDIDIGGSERGNKQTEEVG